jgi:hypothetical protein
MVICTIILLLLFPASSFGYTVLGYFHRAQHGPGGLADWHEENPADPEREIEANADTSSIIERRRR